MIPHDVVDGNRTGAFPVALFRHFHHLIGRRRVALGGRRRVVRGAVDGQRRRPLDLLDERKLLRVVNLRRVHRDDLRLCLRRVAEA